MVSRNVVIMVLVLAIVASASVLTYDAPVEYTAGAGENTMTFVVDYGLESFAFEYKWDTPAGPNEVVTGWNALSAIDFAGAVDVNATDYGPGWGYFVNEIEYPTAENYDYGEGVVAGWTYYGSVDGSSWVLNPGISSRTLSAGDWDCFVWTNYDEWWAPIRSPGEEPIPEPVSLALLALGGLFLRNRRV